MEENKDCTINMLVKNLRKITFLTQFASKDYWKDYSEVVDQSRHV